VIIRACNAPTLCRRSIDRVLSRGTPNMEHIGADGGSTAGTLDIPGPIFAFKLLSSPVRMYDALIEL